MNCPKCDAELDFEPADPSVGIECGGWYCDPCDLFTSEYDSPREPMEGDVPVTFIDPDRKPGDPIGTPISEISTVPGTPGYEHWLRISRSYGHD